MTWSDAGMEGPIGANLDEALQRQEAIFRNTFVESLGVTIEDLADGFAVAAADVGPRFKHPGGFAHGGAIAGLGDTAAAWATMSVIGEGETHSTIEFKANFLRSVSEGKLRAEARVVHRGRKTIVCDVRITTADEEARLIALMTVTEAVLPLAEGRPDQPR